MSYSTDPVLDAQRHFDGRDAYQSAQDKAEADMTSEFLAAVKAGDMQELAMFAPMRGELVRGVFCRDFRYQTVAEVMVDSLDYGKGPGIEDVIGFVASVANKPGQDHSAAAQLLITKMACAFAWYNAEVSE